MFGRRPGLLDALLNKEGREQIARTLAEGVAVAGVIVEQVATRVADRAEKLGEKIDAAMTQMEEAIMDRVSPQQEETPAAPVAETAAPVVEETPAPAAVEPAAPASVDQAPAPAAALKKAGAKKPAVARMTAAKKSRKGPAT